MKITHVLLAFLVVCISMSGQALIKAGLNAGKQASLEAGVTRPALIIMNVLSTPLFWAGLIVMVTGALTYFLLLWTTNFTQALPIMGAFANILIPLIGVFFLKESMSLSQYVGLGMLMVGATLVSR
jgi:uncharacterized membrane protein